jgi:hypothetical protein
MTNDDAAPIEPRPPRAVRWVPERDVQWLPAKRIRDWSLAIGIWSFHAIIRERVRE